MESQPQNPEFRNNPENFHPCIQKKSNLDSLTICFSLELRSAWKSVQCDLSPKRFEP